MSFAARGVPQEIQTINRSGWTGTGACDVLVFNANRKGVCFDGNDTYFVSDIVGSMTTRGYGSGGKYSFKQKLTSSKFTSALFDNYAETIKRAKDQYGAISANDYIYLPDAPNDSSRDNEAAQLINELASPAAKKAKAAAPAE